jgi:hypothetical protein
VGRDALLAIELGKTRTLAIRVAGRVQERWGDEKGTDIRVDEDEEGDGEVVMIKDEGRRKLEEIMRGW